MEPRHSSVVDPVDLAAQGLCGEGGLLADRQVAGPGGYHGDIPRQGVGGRVCHRQMGGGGVIIWDPAPQKGFLLLRQAGDDDVFRLAGDHGIHDPHDLFRRLARAEDHLRCALAGGAVVVHLGVAQVLVTGLAQQPGGGFRRDRAGADFFQDVEQLFLVHGVPLQRQGSA